MSSENEFLPISEKSDFEKLQIAKQFIKKQQQKIGEVLSYNDELISIINGLAENKLSEDEVKKIGEKTLYKGLTETISLKNKKIEEQWELIARLKKKIEKLSKKL